jgi:hypothetical protein
MPSKRTIITLSEEDKRWLETYSNAHRISLAEAIRQGINKLKETAHEDTYRAIVVETKGIWKLGDGLQYQTKIRSEWNPS